MDQSKEEFFRWKCNKYLDLKGLRNEEYEKRLNYEIDVIISMGFHDYFLVVADFVNWAKENNIPVGPGRGSAAGSLVSYVLDITTIDPIRYGLFFERFLNPSRAGKPDYSLDIGKTYIPKDLTIEKLFDILQTRENINVRNKEV